MNKCYEIYGEQKDYDSTKLFISNYYEGIVENQKSRYNIIKEHVPPKVYVLDYGCGWGIFSKLLSEKGCKVDGIDRDKSSIEIAKDIVKENEMLKFDNINISKIADATYDYVISNQVIEHTHNPGNYLMECNRVLKEKGYLVISLPNIINLRFLAGQLVDFDEKFKEYFYDFNYDKVHHHIQAWDPLTFMRLLHSMGFKYVAHELTEGMPLPKGKYINYNIPRIKNMSYTMLFKVQKIKFVKIDYFD